ncbi:hypothetical protein M3626_21855, partial [Psychrobacillus sp. MER TA 17]|nr:hypothetical protein [Psychrobacillus sp. MER TA 17]
YVPFNEPVPDRRVVLVWRKSFTRMPAIDAIDQRRHLCLRAARRREARHAGHDELTHPRMRVWRHDERGLAAPFIFPYRIDEIYQIQIIDRCRYNPLHGSAS